MIESKFSIKDCIYIVVSIRLITRKLLFKLSLNLLFMLKSWPSHFDAANQYQILEKKESPANKEVGGVRNGCVRLLT